MVETHTVTRTVCPAELDQPAPVQPSPAADARISMNASGGAYLAQLVAWGRGVLAQLTDAATSCHAAQAAEAKAVSAPAGAVQP